MDNYYITAIRMYDSSKILHTNLDYFNACYMAGYVIECYAKIIISIVYTAQTIEIAHLYRHSIKDLDREIKYVLNDSNIGSVINPKYILNIDSNFPDICKGIAKWDPFKRYDDSYPWDQNTSNKFQSQIINAINILLEMKVDGLL
jgi:hypothetical protein